MLFVLVMKDRVMNPGLDIFCDDQNAINTPYQSSIFIAVIPIC